MKKILILMLAVLLCVATLASCNVNVTTPTTPATEATEDSGTDATEPLMTTEQALKNAVAYVRNMYKNYLTANETAADFELVSVVKVANVDYTIEWTVDNDAVQVEKGDGKVVINVNEETSEEIEYTLTGVVVAADGTKSDSFIFKLKVPAFKVLSYDEYYKTEAGKAVVIKGIVASVHSQQEGNKYNQLYLHDANGTGGYYVYSMKKDPVKDLGIKAGMTVSVTGTKDIYSGLHEVKDAEVAILDSTVKTLAPLDITEAFTKATDLKDANLVNKLGMLVTIKGVEITDQDLSEKSQYLNFKLGENTSYIRVYRTDLPVSAGGDDGIAAILKGHTDHKAWKADVTGVVIVYGGAIYLNPVSTECFNYIEKIERDYNSMIDVEAGNIKLPENVLKETVVTLPTVGATYSDIKITYKSNNNCAVVDGGKITITPVSTEQTVTITATFTIGTTTKTATYTVKVEKKSPITATTAPAADTAYKGYILQVKKNEKLYLDGGVSGRYLTMTTDVAKAVAIYAEKSGEGYKFYMLDGTAKKYIEIYNNADEKISVKYSDNGSVFTHIAASNAWATKVDGEDYYLGTYNDFNTVSASKTSYITAENTGVSQFPLELVTISCDHTYSGDCDASCNECGAAREATGAHKYDNDCDADCNTCGAERTPAEHADANSDKKCDSCGADMPGMSITAVTVPAVDTAYKGYILQASNKENLYLDGNVSGRYLSMTTDASKAVALYAEKSGDGYKFYILDGSAKKYIEIYNNADSKLSVQYSDNGSVFTHIAETNAWATTFDGVDYYLGTYSTFNTVSASKTSYITAENTGVSQFPLELVTISCDHTYSGDCDAICNDCGAAREATGAHKYDNDCDADCNTCAAERTPAEHADANSDEKCDSCGADMPDAGAGTGTGTGTGVFTFGANGDAAHLDGDKMTADTATITENGKTLTFTTFENVYIGAFDDKGNSALKLGTSSKVATFAFTVGDDVKSVVIKVAKYKAKDTTVNVNGTDYVIEGSSNDGAYDTITIDTTTTKTVTFTTVSGKCRCMIDAIELVA